MAKYGYIATIGADTNGLTKALRQIDDETQKTNTELREINKALKLDPTNAELLAQKYELLSKKLESAKVKAESLEEVQVKMAKGVANHKAFENAYEPLRKELDEVIKKVKDAEKAAKTADERFRNTEITYDKYKEYRDALVATQKEQAAVEAKITDLEKKFDSSGGRIPEEEYRRYRRELEQTRISASQLEKETRELDNATDQSSKAFRKAVESTKEYQQAMDRLNSSAGELKSKVGGALNDIWNITLKAATAITSTAVAAGAASVKIGSDFDKSMSTVQALSGAAGAELDTLREKAKEMGATTSKTAKESADALSYMALAGWDTQQMLGGLEPILRASEAGNMDLATASDLVTDSMSAMGVSVNDLTHYLDVATKAQSSSNTSLEQLLNAYVIAGGSFKNFNVSLEESATLLGVLANRGIKGSEAGNSLNSVLINLIGASGKSSEAMETLGVSAFDTDGKFIGVTETLEQVSAALEKLDEEQRAVLTAQLGGKTQYDTLQALLSGVNEEYDTLFEKIKDSNGALEDTAKIMRDNLRGDIDSLKSKLQDLGIEVNDQFTESFREAVQVTTKEVSKLSDKISDGELGESLEKIGNAFAKVLEQIAKFSTNTGIPAAINLFEFIADNGELVKSLIIGIGGAFAAWKFGSNLISIYKSFMKFKDAAAQSEIAAKAFNNTLKANIILAVASAIWAAVNALIGFAKNADTANNRIRDYRKEIQELDNDIKELSKTTQESISRSEAEIKVIKDNAKEYEELREEKNRNAEQEERLKDLANDLQQYMPDSIQLIDEQTGAYNSLGNAIDGVIASMKKNAYVQAYENQITEIATAQIEAKKNLEELQKEFDEVDKRLKSKGATYDYYGQPRFFDDKGNPLLGLEILNTPDLNAWNSANRGIKEAEKNIAEYDKQIEELGENIKESYSEFSKNQIVETSADGARIAAEGMAAEYAEEAKNAAKKIEEEQEKIVNNLQKKMENLEYKKNTHQFADDTEYWSERRRVLNENINKDSEEWWKYYDETEKFFADLTEEQKEAYEQQIENQAEALKERKELNDDFTDEMYYDELETVIAALDKESDLYKKYNSEILKGRKELADDLDDEAVKSAKEQAEAVTSQFEKAYAEIKSKREQLLNDFRNIELTETVKDKNGEDMLILKDLDAEIKRLDRYEASIDRLREKGISENLMAEIMNLDYASGTRQDYIDTLLSIPQNKLEQYNRELNALKERQEEAADNAVAEARKKTNEQAEEAMGDVTKMFSGMTKTAYEKGAETIENFYQGMIDSMRDVNDLGTISRVLDSVFSETAGKSGSSGNAYSNGNGLTVGESYIAASTPIVINIDNKKYAEMAIQDIIDKGARSGGNYFHL